MSIQIKTPLFATFISSVTALISYETLAVLVGSIRSDLGLIGTVCLLLALVGVGTAILKSLQPTTALWVVVAANVFAFIMANRAASFLYSGLDSQNPTARIAILFLAYWLGQFAALMVAKKISVRFTKPRIA